jgi:hypothetical protein
MRIMSEAQGSFGRNVHECVDELERRLPALMRRYPPLVIVAAMAAHLGEALARLQRRQVCDAPTARRLLARVGSRAQLTAPPAGPQGGAR